MLILLERVSKWLFLLALVGLGLGWWNRDELPDPDFYSNAIDRAPRQQATDAAPFVTRVKSRRYLIRPRYTYELDGMVVSLHHAGGLDDIYHRDWGDRLNLADLCVIWGHNLRSAVYRRMQFRNTTWTCWASWTDPSVTQVFSGRQLSNNHLLADDPRVQRAIMRARPGDQVHFRGYLADYSIPATGFYRDTSITRDDTGNGACETVYVQDFQIVRRADRGWRLLFRVCAWVSGLSLVAFLVLRLLTPVRFER